MGGEIWEEQVHIEEDLHELTGSCQNGEKGRNEVHEAVHLVVVTC